MRLSENPIKNTQTEQKFTKQDWLAYALPMILFMLITALLEPQFPKAFVWLYILKVFVVTGSLFYFLPVWKSEIRFEPKVILPAVLVGVFVLIV